MTTEVNNVTSSTVARSRDPDQLDPRLVVDAIVRYVFPVVVIVGIENLYSPKIHGRYRQDTDMYKRRKKNNNTQYTLQHGICRVHLFTSLALQPAYFAQQCQ